MQENLSFQIYGSIDEAIHDYCQKFFRKYASGESVYDMDASTPETFVQSIASRYATDPNYADKVLNIIEVYELRRFD